MNQRRTQSNPTHVKPWPLLFFLDKLCSSAFASITITASPPSLSLSLRATGYGAAPPPTGRRTKRTIKQALAALAAAPMRGKLSFRQVTPGGKTTLITGNGKRKKTRFSVTLDLSFRSLRIFSTHEGHFLISSLQKCEMNFILFYLFIVYCTRGRYMDGARLSAEDEKVVVERLLAYHPQSEDKIGCGLESIMVSSEKYQYVCDLWLCHYIGCLFY